MSLWKAEVWINCVTTAYDKRKKLEVVYNSFGKQKMDENTCVYKLEPFSIKWKKEAVIFIFFILYWGSSWHQFFFFQNLQIIPWTFYYYLSSWVTDICALIHYRCHGWLGFNGSDIFCWFPPSEKENRPFRSYEY